MRILGIDFGLRKIGLATTEGFLSEPRGVIKNKNWEPALKKICDQEKIEKIVVGLSEGRLAVKQRQFAQKLAKLTGLPIEFEDETLTSWAALAKMKEAGKRVKDEDAIAAALILQAYLDKLK